MASNTDSTRGQGTQLQGGAGGNGTTLAGGDVLTTDKLLCRFDELNIEQFFKIGNTRSTRGHSRKRIQKM